MSTPLSKIVCLIDLVKEKRFQDAKAMCNQARDEYYNTVRNKIYAADVKRIDCIKDFIENVSKDRQSGVDKNINEARKIIDDFFKEEYRASLKQSKTGTNTATEAKERHNGDRNQIPAPAPEPITERGNQAIATAFRYLYDNEWAHAFEELDRIDVKERQIEQMLLEIVQKAYSFNKDEAEKRREQIVKKAINAVTLGKSPTTKIVGEVELLQRYIHENAHLAQPRLLRVFQDIVVEFEKRWSDHLKKTGITLILNDGMKKYINQCIQVTYLLYLEDPPIRMEYGNPKKQLDETRYDPYTRKGNSIDYIVWPALVNGSGQLLMKGKAQWK